jgi:hypothetical protein
VQDLIEDWGRLRKATPQFQRMRHKWIAHDEVERDPVSQQFRVPGLATSHLNFTRSVCRFITRLVMNLARLLGHGEMKIQKFERQINERAEIFWGFGVK